MLLHFLALIPVAGLPCTITDQIRIGRMTQAEVTEDCVASWIALVMRVWLAWAILHWLYHFNFI